MSTATEGWTFALAAYLYEPLPQWTIIVYGKGKSIQISMVSGKLGLAYSAPYASPTLHLGASTGRFALAV